jgi:hypothetical protein
MASFAGVLIFVLILSPVLIPLVITGVHAVAGHGNRKPPPRSVTGVATTGDKGGHPVRIAVIEHRLHVVEKGIALASRRSTGKRVCLAGQAHP